MLCAVFFFFFFFFFFQKEVCATGYCVTHYIIYLSGTLVHRIIYLSI